MKHRDELVDLFERHALIRDRVRSVVRGESAGFYLHGRPGTSKTYLVLNNIKSSECGYAYSNGHITPLGLFDLIRRNPESIIILDDVSAVFRQPIALQILLAALGRSHDGSRFRPVRYKTAKSDEVAYFGGGIIAISNLPLANHNREVLAALQDRVHAIEYEPTDEQVEAHIFDIASQVSCAESAEKRVMVAEFLIAECRQCEVRPSIRLFVDKALPDFRFWESGQSECDWRDLVRSSVRESTVPQQYPLRNVTRKDRVEAERAIVLEICKECDASERVAKWRERTGKGQSSFYRRYGELKQGGDLSI